MKHNKILLIAILFSIVSCNTLNEKEENVSLNLTDSFELNNKISELFLTFAFEDKIIIFDECDGYIYDYNGNLLTIFGGKGKGPGELLHPFYCYYDLFDKQIVVYDIYALKLVRYNLEGEYIISDEIANLLLYKKNFSGFSVTNYRYLDKKVTDIVEVTTIDSTIISYEKEYDSTNDVRNQRLTVDANDDNIFILDIQQNSYILLCYDKFANMIYKKKGANKNNNFSIFAGKAFLIFASQDKDSGIFIYDIIDSKGNYIDTFTMNSEDNYIVDVYNSKLIKKVIGDTMKIEILNLKFN